MDVILTLKLSLEQNNANKRFEAYAYNDSVIALSEFKPNFYGVLLTDIKYAAYEWI